MRRYRVRLVLGMLAAFAFVAFAAGTADARGKRKRKRAPKEEIVNIDESALGELKGEFRFGMSHKEVLQVLGREVHKRYAELIKQTNDVYKQDQLRRKRDAEIKRIAKSVVEFKGERSGWDTSIIDDQFGHNTDESMMVYWENKDGKDQRRFFFFHEGKLYKMFVALNAPMLKGEQKKFSYFQKLMEDRYGAGKVVYKTDSAGVEQPVAIEWRTKKYLVRAVNKLDFYGAFCVLIADPPSERKVIALREANKKPERSNAVIESVLSKDGDEGPSLDENSQAVDAILKD